MRYMSNDETNSDLRGAVGLEPCQIIDVRGMSLPASFVRSFASGLLTTLVGPHVIPLRCCVYARENRILNDNPGSALLGMAGAVLVLGGFYGVLVSLRPDLAMALPIVSNIVSGFSSIERKYDLNESSRYSVRVKNNLLWHLLP